MREIDQVRITLLRMFRGTVQLPQEIIDEMLKPFLHTRNATRIQKTIRSYLVRARTILGTLSKGGLEGYPYTFLLRQNPTLSPGPYWTHKRAQRMHLARVLYLN